MRAALSRVTVKNNRYCTMIALGVCSWLWVKSNCTTRSPTGLMASTKRRITYRFTKDGRIVLMTTFRKQRNNERSEVLRARKVADICARRYP